MSVRLCAAQCGNQLDSPRRKYCSAQCRRRAEGVHRRWRAVRPESLRFILDRSVNPRYWPVPEAQP